MSEFNDVSPETQASWQRFAPRLREEIARDNANEPSYSEEGIEVLHELEKAVGYVTGRKEVVIEAEQIIKDSCQD